MRPSEKKSKLGDNQKTKPSKFVAMAGFNIPGAAPAVGLWGAAPAAPAPAAAQPALFAGFGGVVAAPAAPAPGMFGMYVRCVAPLNILILHFTLHMGRAEPQTKLLRKVCACVASRVARCPLACGVRARASFVEDSYKRTVIAVQHSLYRLVTLSGGAQSSG